MEEILQLLKENNAMLKRIVAYIDKVESPEYRNSEDSKQLLFNLSSDMLTILLSQNPNSPLFQRGG